MALRARGLNVTRATLRFLSTSTSSIDTASDTTHTGQVNKQFAEKLISEVPPVASSDVIVSCDGGGGALGHPKVYINLDQPGDHTCGYCGLRFYLDKTHHN